MFIIIEFEKSSGGGLAIVHNKWLTPRKGEVFWPPHKDRQKYIKALKNGDEVSENWPLFKVAEKFYETDDFEKAVKKIKKLETDDNIATTDFDENQIIKVKRVRKRPRKFLSEDSDSEDIENQTAYKRPPKISFHLPSTSHKSLVTNPPVSFEDSLLAVNNYSVSNSNKSSTFFERNSPKDQQRSTPCMNESFPDLNNSFLEILNAEETKRSAFQKTVLTEIYTIKEQINKILNLLENNSQLTFRDKNCNIIQDNFPVKFPLKSDEDVEKLNEFLQTCSKNSSMLISYLSTLGGNDIVSSINRILKHLLSNELASRYSFLGKRNKKSFSDLEISKNIICKCFLIIL